MGGGGGEGNSQLVLCCSDKCPAPGATSPTIVLSLPPSLPDGHIVSVMDALAGSPLYLETESLRTVLSSVADQLACITDTVRRKGEGEGEEEEEEMGGEGWAGGGIGGEERGEGRGEKKRGRKDIISVSIFSLSLVPAGVFSKAPWSASVFLHYWQRMYRKGIHL